MILRGGILNFHLAVTVAPYETSYGGREDMTEGSSTRQSFSRVKEFQEDSNALWGEATISFLSASMCVAIFMLFPNEDVIL